MPPADSAGIVIAEMNSPALERRFPIEPLARQRDRNRHRTFRLPCDDETIAIASSAVSATAGSDGCTAWHGPRVEDREILILAILRGARRSAVLETGDPAPEVPAARTLAEISADRAHVPQRRRARRRRTPAPVRGIARGRCGDRSRYRRCASPRRCVTPPSRCVTMSALPGIVRRSTSDARRGELSRRS